MYPPLTGLSISLIIFFELYFLVLFNFGQQQFQLSGQEIIACLTVFSFLLCLRLADDLKDYQTDCRLFPKRPLPSGRVKKSDLIWLLLVVVSLMIIFNLIFMNNLPYFVFLLIYGALMSVWFFQKHRLQKSLPLALITHNPIQLIINFYVISFVCFKYNLPLLSPITLVAALTLYFPTLIWEITRKIKAPSQETSYVTYSKLFGVNRAVNFVLLLTFLDLLTNIFLIWQILALSAIPLCFNVIYLSYQLRLFKRQPTKFVLVKRILTFDYIQEALMLATLAIYFLLR
jgi:4-hydroxybenzoate polyprenyltransferase